MRFIIHSSCCTTVHSSQLTGKVHILRYVVRLLTDELVKSLMVDVILVCDRFKIVLKWICVVWQAVWNSRGRDARVTFNDLGFD